MPSPYDFCDYTKFWLNRDYEDKTERNALKIFFNLVDKRDDLIDIGGGFGRLAKTYSPIFKNCLIIEPSQKNIDLGLKINDQYKNVRFQKGSIPNLKVNNKTFDVALVVRVSHHLKDLSPLFAEVQRVLRPKGYFIIEIANKINFISSFRQILKGNFKYITDYKITEKKSLASRKKRSISFVNHHPLEALTRLKNNNFKIVKILSVSNFRNPLVKKIFPVKILVSLDTILGTALSKIYFGPSIFILAQKQ